MAAHPNNCIAIILCGAKLVKPLSTLLGMMGRKAWQQYPSFRSKRVARSGEIQTKPHAFLE